jgi:hypothetical protein
MFELSKYTLKKMKDKNVKQILPKDGYQWEGGRHKERVKEGEEGRCILHSCVKIEQ